MQEELQQHGSKRNFSLFAFGIWLTVLASSFGLLRTIHPGIYHEDLVPLALGGCLLGVGLAMPIIFLYRASRGSAGFFYAGLLGAVVAAAVGLATSALILRGVLGSLMRGGGVFEGFMIIMVPILGAFFGGIGGCVGGTLPATGKRFWIALGIGGGLPLGLVGIPSCVDGGRSDIVWGVVITALGVLGTLSGQWLTRGRHPETEEPQPK